MSHTATMIGEDNIFEALCRQVGFLRANTLFNSIDLAAVLIQQPLPRGRRIGIQGTGGQCMIVADTLMSYGLDVPELDREHADLVVSGLGWAVHAPPPVNPVDHAGAHTAFMDATVINRLASLDYIDGVISNVPVTFHQASGASAEEQAAIDRETGELLAAVPLEYRKPLILIGPTAESDQAFFPVCRPVSEAIKSSGIFCCQTPEEAALAMATLVRYADIQKRFAPIHPEE
jgi:acetyltransferase